MERELLVVDDEPKIAAALKQLFESKGFQVQTAHTVHDAELLVEQKAPQVVLLDLRLPDGSGMDLLLRLKAAHPELRVVVLSGLSDAHTVHEAMSRGANDFLTKPFDFERCFNAAMGVESVELSQIQPDAGALERVPSAIARQYQALPLCWHDGQLHLAMADPFDDEAVNALQELLRCDIVPVAVISGSLDGAIAAWYQPKARPSPQPSQPAVSTAGGADALESLVRLAVKRRATDLHAGISSDGVWVRLRCDGQVADVPTPASLRGAYPALLEHVKQSLRGQQPCAGPLSGRLPAAVDGQDFSLEISVAPSLHGEHLAMRLAPKGKPLDLKSLGMDEAQQRHVAAMLKRLTGLVVVAGPGRSGRSTTLTAALLQLAARPLQIVTLEERVEREIPRATQLVVGPERGLNFRQAFQAAANHDPDVICVSDLWDAATAQLAVQAALAGRLVLTSLAAPSAASAVMRLMDLGVEPFQLCATLSGVVAQQLVRTLCPACRQRLEVDAGQLGTLGLKVPGAQGTLGLWQARGCDDCAQSGYAGRTGLFEVLPVDQHMRALIIKRTAPAQMHQSAMARGMLSLREAAWLKAQTGQTSLQELHRVLSGDSSA